MAYGETIISPRIRSLSWGRMEIEGLPPGKDFKLWPGGGREWNWQETGTNHMPGIQPSDLEELIQHGCEQIVLSRGMLQRLQTAPETMELLRKEGIELVIEETRQAADIYNELAERGVAVGGLFHSTC
jgi:hypothetical protein